MGLFSKPIKNYLGVDLGSSVIKLVELSNLDGKANLVTYGYAQKTVKVVTGDAIDNSAELVAILKDLCVKSKVTTKKAITALSAPSVFSSVINLSNITDADLKNPAKIEEAVNWEAKKVVPLPLEEMVLDWKLLPSKTDNKKGDSTKSFPVLLTGAAKKLVQKYMDVFSQAGLDLISLETESFALIRALVGNDKSVIMIVDMGAINTYVMIVDNGIPFLDRTINTGGLNITKAIAQSLNISVDKAEQFKMDLSLSEFAKEQKLPKLVEDILKPIIHEIRYTYNLYQQDEYGGKNIEKVILCGGGALIPNLAQYLSSLLQVRVFLGDPWARVLYNDELRPILNEIGPQFAIALGLAMRDIS